MSLSFRTRLMIWFVLTVGGLTMLAGITLAYRGEGVTERELDKTLTMIATVGSRSTSAGKGRPTTAGAAHYFSLEDRQRHALRFSDNLPRPLPIDSVLLERSPKGEMVYRSVDLEDVGPLRVVYLPRPDRSDSGAVLPVGIAADIFRNRVLRFDSVILIFGLLLAALSGAGGVAKDTLGPIEPVTTAAQQTTARDLTEKLPVSADGDEIGGVVNVFIELLSRLESAYIAQRQFSSRVAHELRTPLTIMKGETQVTLNRKRSTEEYEAQLLSILEEVGKMERTIDGLLMFARYESEETEIPLRPVRLDSVVAEIAKDLRPLAEGRRMNFETDTSEDAVVLGDEQALSRLVCKLIENALQYTPKGGCVEVTATTNLGQTILSVKDTGIGIASKDVSHIFERFFRSEKSRNMNPKGTGIGLAIVDVIARLHRAEINVDSRPNAGTEFTITFPPPAIAGKSVE